MSKMAMFFNINYWNYVSSVGLICFEMLNNGIIRANSIIDQVMPIERSVATCAMVGQTLSKWMLLSKLNIYPQFVAITILFLFNFSIRCYDFHE